MEKHAKNEVKKISQKSIFYKKLFFQTLVEYFLEVLRACLRYLIGTPSIWLCSRKEIRGAKHVDKQYSRKNDLFPTKNALFGGPDIDIRGVPKKNGPTYKVVLPIVGYIFNVFLKM